MLLAGVQSCGARAENAWQRTAGRIASRAVSERCILFSEKQRLTFVLSVRTQGMSGTEVGGAEAVPAAKKRERDRCGQASVVRMPTCKRSLLCKKDKRGKGAENHRTLFRKLTRRGLSG